MCKYTFSKLNLKLQGFLNFNKNTGGRGLAMSCEKALLMALWYLGHGNLFLVAEKFNVAISTAHKYTGIIVDALIHSMNQYIRWPNTEELATIERKFAQLCGYPGVVGAIDGTNIQFKAPLLQQQSYIDKNCNHSIKLQAVCTKNKIITNINVGFPGSVHDSRVFKNSSIYTDILENNNEKKYFPRTDNHLLGEKAYPLLTWLITPYKQVGHLQRHQIIHNKKHSSTRVVIENTFGILKARWRILKMINVNSVKKAIKIITECCVLHNFCLINCDEWEEEQTMVANNEEDFNKIYDNRAAAIVKRNNISRLL